jgi:hypothetical protein
MERDSLEDPSVDGRIISRWISRKRDGGHGLDWSVQDRNRRWCVINAVMNLRVPKNAVNFLTS